MKDVKALAVTVSTPLPQTLVEELDHIATLAGRDRAWLIEAALRQYIAQEKPHFEAVARSRAQYKAGNYVEHSVVMEELDRWEEENFK